MDKANTTHAFKNKGMITLLCFLKVFAEEDRDF